MAFVWLCAWFEAEVCITGFLAILVQSRSHAIPFPASTHSRRALNKALFLKHQQISVRGMHSRSKKRHPNFFSSKGPHLQAADQVSEAVPTAAAPELGGSAAAGPGVEAGEAGEVGQRRESPTPMVASHGPSRQLLQRPRMELRPHRRCGHGTRQVLPALHLGSWPRSPCGTREEDHLPAGTFRLQNLAIEVRLRNARQAWLHYGCLAPSNCLLH